MIIRTNDDEHLFAVSRGVIQVGPAGVRVLSDIADRAETLDESVIEIAKARAEELRNARRDDAEGFADASATLSKEIARLASARRLRSRRRRSV